MREPQLFTAANLRTGLQAEFERDIAVEDVAAFAELSHDLNPLHIDDEYARQTNYGKRIVHGAFQVGLASAMTGMYLPGREVVVGSFQCRFPAPLYYPSRVQVHGEITAWVPQSTSGTLRVRVVELSTSTLTAEIHVGFSLHETRSASLKHSEAKQPRAEGKPIVLLTGASGGLGQRIAAVLLEFYCVIGMVRGAVGSAQAEQSDGNMEWVTADLNASDWEGVVAQKLHGRRLYGLVHAAWPPGPQGSLLDVEVNAVRAQLEFGAVVTIRVARFLRSQAVDSGARLVVLGTTAATIKPALNMAAYSLGKATLEHTIRLLAPELARGKITVNAVAPSFVPVGMNSVKTNQVILRETAKVPFGRLCSPEDVARTVDFFLSPGAAFVTGQMLPLTGGQL
jgi:NAD(P)-dependent dehydrogenase (short-subunit alcohol dehydrogenase family)/acyl dehydratase